MTVRSLKLPALERYGEYRFGILGFFGYFLLLAQHLADAAEVDNPVRPGRESHDVFNRTANLHRSLADEQNPTRANVPGSSHRRHIGGAAADNLYGQFQFEALSSSLRSRRLDQITQLFSWRVVVLFAFVIVSDSFYAPIVAEALLHEGCRNRLSS
jgi:hypothetical protein